MVRNYKRKTITNYSEEDIEKAMEDLKNGAECLTVSKHYNIPRSTLRNRMRILKETPDHNFGKRGAQPVFNQEQEKQIADMLLQYEQDLVGMTTADARAIAYNTAEMYQVKNNFDNEKKLAGRDWLQRFMKRQGNISLRKPEHTSAARASGFNREVVERFFDKLEETVLEHNIAGEDMWNCDETPVSTVPKGSCKVIGAKGKKQCGGLTSAERGEHVTAEICFSAAGVYMPPLLIFPRKNRQEKFVQGAPDGAIIEFHPSGYMQTEIFRMWMEKFIEFTKPSKDKKVLLLLDGHSTHTRNTSALQLAKENHVIVLVFPPHTTHKLQPVDITFNKPLSDYFAAEHTKWMRKNRSKGKLLTLANLFEVFTPAYELAATISNARKGFEKAGIYPFNRNAFFDKDFCNRISVAPTDVPDQNFAAIVHEAVNLLSSNGDPPTLIPTDSLDSFEIESLPIDIVDGGLVSHESDCTGVNDNLSMHENNLQLIPAGLIEESSLEKKGPGRVKVAAKRKRIFNGQAGVLTGDDYLQDLENSKKKQKKPRVSKAKDGSRQKLGDISNQQQMTSVNLQFCAPIPPYYFPSHLGNYPMVNNNGYPSMMLPQTAANFSANSATATTPQALHPLFQMTSPMPQLGTVGTTPTLTPQAPAMYPLTSSMPQLGTVGTTPTLTPQAPPAMYPSTSSIPQLGTVGTAPTLTPQAPAIYPSTSSIPLVTTPNFTPNDYASSSNSNYLLHKGKKKKI